MSLPSHFLKNEPEKDSNQEFELKIGLVREVLEQVKQITEFNEQELKAISMIQNDRYLQELLVFYIANKKHIRRKFSKEILDVFGKISMVVAEQAANFNMQSGGVFR